MKDLYRIVTENDVSSGKKKCGKCSLTEGCDIGLEECGGDMEQDNESVSMDVNMHGSGTEGIRELMSVLKNLEKGETTKDFPSRAGDDRDELIDDDYANSPDIHTKSTGAVLSTGDDIHSKGGKAYPATAGGGNPMLIQSKLESLYNRIKAE